MPLWSAKALYYWSIGFDASEWPIAPIKEGQRQQTLCDRIGYEAYLEFMKKRGMHPDRITAAPWFDSDPIQQGRHLLMRA